MRHLHRPTFPKRFLSFFLSLFLSLSLCFFVSLFFLWRKKYIKRTPAQSKELSLDAICWQKEEDQSLTSTAPGQVLSYSHVPRGTEKFYFPLIQVKFPKPPLQLFTVESERDG